MSKNDIGLFNPLVEDFTCQYNLDGAIEKYTIPSKDIAYFKPEVVNHIKKHLYDAIVNARELNGIALNADPAQKQAIFDEIELK